MPGKTGGVPPWEVLCMLMHLSLCSLFALPLLYHLSSSGGRLLPKSLEETWLRASNSPIFCATVSFPEDNTAIAASTQFMICPVPHQTAVAGQWGMQIQDIYPVWSPSAAWGGNLNQFLAGSHSSILCFVYQVGTDIFMIS